MTLNPIAVEELVRRALMEDIGPEDRTTSAVVPADANCTAVVIARDAGILCGHPVAEAAFRAIDASLRYEALVGEGSEITAGQGVARISGRARSVLAAERVALNFLQHMSGIATTTRRLAEAIKYYHARLVESRETTPGLRMIERYAVRIGGGQNHRLGLGDAIAVKANHLALAGGVREAVVAARKSAPHTCRVSVEVRTLEELEEGLDAGADILVLVDMDAEMLKRAVEITSGRAVLEAAGVISPANLVEVAKTGVDIIALGALTHSVTALPFVLEVAP
ncbi:carboxylating nicotinate-nucleotide diphosphorylase [Symbiobacterium terraclitae]|uniref:carboxylating nicotinate-nucleotide diphosphorylase n=1 Tax=Symbiobacterium terraclitae TaxID=557451 RepID=UPI0035B5681C